MRKSCKAERGNPRLLARVASFSSRILRVRFEGLLLFLSMFDHICEQTLKWMGEAEPKRSSTIATIDAVEYD